MPDDFELSKLLKRERKFEKTRKKEIRSTDDLRARYAELNENKRHLTKKVSGK